VRQGGENLPRIPTWPAVLAEPPSLPELPADCARWEPDGPHDWPSPAPWSGRESTALRHNEHSCSSGCCRGKDPRCLRPGCGPNGLVEGPARRPGRQTVAAARGVFLRTWADVPGPGQLAHTSVGLAASNRPAAPGRFDALGVTGPRGLGHRGPTGPGPSRPPRTLVAFNRPGGPGPRDRRMQALSGWAGRPPNRPKGRK